MWENLSQSWPLWLLPMQSTVREVEMSVLITGLVLYGGKDHTQKQWNIAECILYWIERVLPALLPLSIPWRQSSDPCFSNNGLKCFGPGWSLKSRVPGKGRCFPETQIYTFEVLGNDTPSDTSLSIFYWASSDIPRPAGATGIPLSLCCTGSARSTSAGFQCPGQRAVRWHWEVTQSPKAVSALSSSIPKSSCGWPLLSAGDTGAPRSIPRARIITASQGCSCPCPAWARHYPQCSAARTPLVLQTTEWHFSITQKWSNFYNCLSKWCIKWKDNLFL